MQRKTSTEVRFPPGVVLVLGSVLYIPSTPQLHWTRLSRPSQEKSGCFISEESTDMLKQKLSYCLLEDSMRGGGGGQKGVNGVVVGGGGFVSASSKFPEAGTANNITFKPKCC